MPYPDYAVGEALFEGSDLRIVDAEDPDKPEGQRADSISHGGTGVVYKAIQAETIERAVKILQPAEHLIVDQAWEDFEKTFEKEKKQLSQLTHSHLVKLISFGALEDHHVVTLDGEPVPIPYLVMEYIRGKPLQYYLRDNLNRGRDTPPNQVVADLLGDVLSALQYMHEKQAMHSDVKEANILVRESNRPEAILVDLGAAHVFVDPRPELTTYITTKGRVTSEWSEKILKKVSAEELREKREYLDLLTFGSMLALFLNLELPHSPQRPDWGPEVLASLQAALGEGIVVLHRIAAKCLGGRYSSAKEVVYDLASITESYVSPLGVPELSIGTNAKTSLALPTDSLPLTERITSVVNHPCVQRLRRLQQLDFVSLIAVGATHTRLLHSLETYRLCRRYVGNLIGDPRFRAYCGDKNKLQSVLLASLLHDVGHYPLEHIFEDFAYKAEGSGPYSGILRDEDVTAAVVGTTTEKNRFVVDVVSAYLGECRPVLRSERLVSLPELIGNEFGSEVPQVLGRILAERRDDDEGIEILQSIVSGPLDVDKVSYLHADSYFSGVSYGKAIDVDSLLSSLTCIVSESPPGQESWSPRRGALAIRDKGVCAAEAIATGRRWMFQRVYWHKTNRAIMAMLRFAPQVLLGDGSLSFREYFGAVYALSDIEAVKWLDRRFQEQYGDDASLANPAQMIVDGRRGIYKEFMEFPGAEMDTTAQRVRRYLINRNCAEWLGITKRVVEVLQKYTEDVLLSDVLLDLPSAQRHDIGDVVVFLGSALRKARLSEVSDEFRSARDFFHRGAMSCRIFIHPEVRRKLAGTGKIDSARREVRELLSALAPR